MSRTVLIRIAVDNKDALNAVKTQREAMRQMHDEIKFGNEEMRKSEKHAKSMTSANKQLEASIVGLTASIVKGYLIGRATAAVFNSLAQSFTYAAREAINFEFQMDKIAAITGNGEATLRSLESTIRNVASATNLSQNELAKTALEMSKLGLSSSQVENALQGVANLARGLDEDLVTTGETVVAILNTYNFSAEEAGRVTDQLAFTVKASALDLQKFGTAFSYVGGTAAAAGVSFEELQGAMDVLSNAGIRSSTIGTQLRRIIADLSDEQSKASIAAGGTIESYGGLANALDALGQKNIDIAGLTEIFGRTASSVAAIAIKYSDVIADMAEQTKNANDLTKEMSGTINDNLKSSIDSVTVAWTDLGIEVSKSTGFIKTWFDGVKVTVDWIKNNIKISNEIADFRKNSPETVQRMEDELNARNGGAKFKITDSMIENSPEFEVYKAKMAEYEEQKKIRENLVSELMSTFDQKMKLPADFDPKTDDIAPEDTMTWRWIRQLVGDDVVFEKARKRAISEFAMKRDKLMAGDEFDTSIFDKKKNAKFKLNSASNFLLGITAGAEPNSKDNEDWLKSMEGHAKLADERAEADEKAAESMAKYAKSVDMVSSKSDYKEWLEETRAEMELWTMTQEALNASIDIFASFWANDMVTSAENGFKGISDAFGDMAKRMIAQLISLTIRFAVFKLLLTGLGLAPAASPFFSFAHNSAGGTGFLDAILGGLGGKQFKAAANGYEGMVNSPKLFLAGENGPERVSIRPSTNSMGNNTNGGGMTIVVQGDIYNAEKFVDKVALTNERSRTRYI